jgi:hypothetical protein
VAISPTTNRARDRAGRAPPRFTTSLVRVIRIPGRPRPFGIAESGRLRRPSIRSAVCRYVQGGGEPGLGREREARRTTHPGRPGVPLDLAPGTPWPDRPNPLRLVHVAAVDAADSLIPDERLAL